MANKRVTLYKYCNLGDGKWRYCRPVMNKNHSLSSEQVYFNGKVERHPEGAFYLHWYEGSRKQWLRLGTDLDRIVVPELAQLPIKLSSAIKIIELRLGRGEATPPKRLEKGPERDFQVVVNRFLTDLADGGRPGLKPARPATVALFKQTLGEFAAGHWNNAGDGGWSKLPAADDAGMEQMRRDMFAYRSWLEKCERAPGTIGKKLDRLNQFLRIEHGLKPGKGPVKRSDFDQWGYYDDDEEVEIYSKEEITKFFSACTSFEHLLFSVFLESGFRSEEVTWLTWADVDFALGKLTVSRKPGFNPKTKQSLRSVTVSKTLMARLLALKETTTGEFVFHRDRKPLSNGTMLGMCKAVAKRAGLDPRACWLHKFRHTSATNFLSNCSSAAGALKMLMARLGHKNLKTTERYLAKLPAHEEQVIVEGMAVAPPLDYARRRAGRSTQNGFGSDTGANASCAVAGIR